MANVAHSTLTGSDLHEPKGIATADADDVYIADGAGSGAWTPTSAFNPFGAALIHIQDQKSSGTAGGTFTTGAQRTRDLNTTVTNEITGASLSSNQITLPAGTYWIEVRCLAYAVSQHRLFLRNMTDASNTMSSLSHSNGTNTNDVAFMRGRFTIASQKVFEIQHQCGTTVITSGFGASGGLGTEIYSDVCIWKLED
jgi:hypothetical protein